MPIAANRLSLIILVVWNILNADVIAMQDGDLRSRQQIEFFENEIRPLLIKHCLDCHGDNPDKISGGLWLTSRAGMLQGGDSGPAVVPKHPDDSILISAINYDDFEMPPSGQLSQIEIDAITRWVEMGVPDPRKPRATKPAASIDLVTGREFWAFRQRSQPKTPAVKNEDWAKSAIDYFVLAKLEQEDLQPVATADRTTLIRRAYMTMIGLPPTIEQIERFVKDTDPIDVAFARIVDMLLDSQHFGERWGRHWLDVARFAESSGGGRSLMFPNAWRFRDYVIDSFNRDKPFDQFIMEQIAGDLLPFATNAHKQEQLVGAGFLVLGPNNYELQDKEKLQMEVVDEQIDTFGRAFLGLTLGCARCHDHKFDPIPTSDYYALAGIFKSTKSLVDGNVSKYVEQKIATDSELEIKKIHDAKIKDLTTKLANAKNGLGRLGGTPKSNLVPSKKSRASSLFQGIVIDNKDATLVGDWKLSTSEPFFIDQDYQHDSNQNKGQQSAVYTPNLTRGGLYDVQISYSAGGNRASNVPVTIDHQDGKTTVIVNQSQRPPIEGIFVSLGTFRFEANNVSVVTISTEGTDGHVIIDAVRFVTPKNEGDTNQTVLDMEPAKRQTALKQVPNAKVTEVKNLIKRLNKELVKLKKDSKPLNKAMSVTEQKRPADGHIHIRGNVRSLGEIVPRGFVSVCNQPGFDPAIGNHESGRLQLAQWIASPDHPLTARVYVNRIWRQLFGRGLVRSTDNFGAMGTRPTHPELLDFLANEFVTDGWSTKTLIRKIMLSRVYQLATTSNQLNSKLDNENRYFWRANRRRLDAEAIRDSILFVSGKLDTTMGGLTIRKLAAYDLGYEFDTVRRSVYVPAFRNAMLDLFEVFDFANPNLVTGDRNTSTLPTQALYMMNSSFVIEQSRFAAERLLQQDDMDTRSSVVLAYRWTLGRIPSEMEVEESTNYLSSFGDQEAEGWTSLFHALFSSLDFRYMN